MQDLPCSTIYQCSNVPVDLCNLITGNDNLLLKDTKKKYAVMVTLYIYSLY